MNIEFHFANTSALQRFLHAKMWSFSGPKKFYDWLEGFADTGVFIDSIGGVLDYKDLCDLV
ncbi:MAG: hypothetical protein SOR93_06530 [Clostridiales Family XIII bacterium]|uniref:Uncharacterized protein n=1 Tax=Hominibacterium faecale TaxID=2839743 RepID=A0A9J6QZM6_9FIRM|nr:hypothetical protein [Hominibacterium faecale]MCI7300452.1 hypothetical protein [Clostridia bacterium]MCU7380961.1 hypothetical protein [Hominibacterium faecale]MDY3010910.1 hypothetical protein [Clostridiales Family XIII bacterium]